MSTIINSKSKNPFYIQDNVTSETPPSYTATLYAESAGNIIVYAAPAAAAVQVPINITIIGSGTNAGLKFFALAVNRSFTSATNSITLTNLSIGTVYGGPIVSTNANTAAIASKYLYTTVGPVTTITTAVVTGDTSITIENGKYGTIYGGGAGYGSKVIGDTTVNYYGGKVSTIYGGGGLGSVVDGDTNVNILGTSTVGSSIGTIYAGGNNSTVTGNTNVTFTSDSALINFRGVVFGGGAGANAIVKGSRNFTFDNYSGNFSGSIRGFTNIDFVGATSVTMLSKQDSSIVGATYNFAINDESLKNTNAMLIWNQKIKLVNNLKVTIDAGVLLKDGGNIDLIASKFLNSEYSFNKNQVLVVNDNGDRVSSLVYTVNYIYDKKLGGEVSIDYKGTALTIDGTQTVKVVLTGSDEEVNIVKGGNLVAGLDTAGGNDIVNIQTGAIVNGGIKTGAGDDTLYIQAGSTVNGYIDMGIGNDRLVVNRDATLTSDVTLGVGVNTLIVQNHAQISGTVILADGSTNNITINGGAVSSFAGGNSETTNNLVVNGARLLLPILGEVFVGGGIGYYQNLLPNSIDVSGVVGTDPVNLSLTLDQENWILANVFVAQDLNLGASNDNVTINSYAQVLNINLGAGDDKLIINDNAIVRGDINLGAGNNILVLNDGNAFTGKLVNEGENVIVVGASMALNGDALNLGSTDNVLVVTNGMMLNLNGVSVGRFLAESQNDGVYLSQNATVTISDTQFIQNYTGQLTTTEDGNLDVLAAPAVVPERIAPYYNALTDGVVASNIGVGGDFTVELGAKVASSNVNVGGDADIDGTVTASNLDVTGDAFVDGTVTGGILDVDGDAFVDGTVTGSTMYVDGDLDVDGTITGSSFVDVDGDVTIGRTGAVNNISNLQVAGITEIDGAVTGSTLNADGDVVIKGSVATSSIVFDDVDPSHTVTFDSAAASFTGSITGAETTVFNYSFTSANLTISTDEINLAKNVAVSITTLDPAIAPIFNFGVDAILTETKGAGAADDVQTVVDLTKDTVFTAGHISILGNVTGDVTFSNATVSFGAGNLVDGATITARTGKLLGDINLNGANTFVVNESTWYDWQQFKFISTATLGFNIAAYKLVAIDGFIGADPVTKVVNNTTFGQNSQLAIGSWVYIHDWKDTDPITGNPRSYELPANPFPQGLVNNLAWENLYVTAGAQIWGGIRLDDNANELVINDGVTVNGGAYYYDYGTIRTLGGDDTVTIGAAIINGRISTGDGADTMTLNGTTVNAAVNQGDAVIDMGAGDDVLDINTAQIGGDIVLGDGNDTATITDSTINGNIDTGAGNDTLTIDPTTVNGNITLGDGNDTATIIASTINGNIDAGAGNDTVIIDALSTVNGNVSLGDGTDVATVSGASTVNGNVTFGLGDNTLNAVSGTVTGNVLFGLPTAPATTNTVNVDGVFGINGKLDMEAAGANAIVLGQTSDLTVGAAAGVNMTGSVNSITTYGADGFGLNTSVAAISNHISAQAVSMNGGGLNLIGLGVIADVDHNLALSGVSMQLDAPVIGMTGSNNVLAQGLILGASNGSTVDVNGATDISIISNAVNMTGASGSFNRLAVGEILDASGKSTINVIDDAAIILAGDINMTGDRNFVSGGIIFDARPQSTINVGGNNVTVDIAGSIAMKTVDTGVIQTNDMLLGYVVPGAGTVNATGNYTVDIGGSILMSGDNSINTLVSDSNVTVGGPIIMGVVSAAGGISLLNNLTVNDPGSFISQSITLTAVTNVVDLEGTGTIQQKLNIYGGTNTLTVGTNVTINDIVQFGGVYDADQVLIQKNTNNNVNIFGTVNGIDTSVDLNAPAGVINDSADIIVVTGSVLGSITTGNGADVATISGTGLVTGSITMGDFSADNGKGAKTLNVLDNAHVTGNVVMESDETNSLTVTGTSPAVHAAIGGDVSMITDTATVLGNNTAVITNGDVGGDVLLAASGLFGDNSLTVAGANVLGVITPSTIGGGIDMMAVNGGNILDLDIATVGNGIGMVAANNNIADITDSTITGSIDLIAGGSNTVTIDPSSVSGDVSLISTVLGDNSLTVTGTNILGVITPSTIGGSVDMAAADGSNTLDLDIATVGNGVGMTAANGSNTADVTDSTITGSINMTAGVDNTLTVDPSTITGNVTMTNDTGLNLATFSDSTVGGSVTMTNNEDVATNSLGVAVVTAVADLPLGYAAGIAGSVTMDSSTTNLLDIAGNVITNPDASTTAIHATIVGPVTMNALRYDPITGDLLENVGNNALTMEYASTIGGAVAMKAGAGNSVTVMTGQINDYTGGGPVDSTQDSIARVASLDMISALNTLTVGKGALAFNDEGTLNVTSVIAGTNNGISMTQAQANRQSDPLTYYYENVITVVSDGRLVLNSSTGVASSIVMGNTADVTTVGSYAFTNITVNGLHLEVYNYVWNGPITATVYDTQENDITVDGRMYADNITMYARYNNIIVTPGAGIQAGEAAFESGDIVMSGGVNGGSPIEAERNVLNDTALFYSGSISMYATDSNALGIIGEVSGLSINESHVTGNVLMVTTARAGSPDTGMNNAALNTTDVIGSVMMIANGVTGDNTLTVNGGIDGFGAVIQSDITGGISMEADNGLNFASINIGTVGSDVIMLALTDNTLLVTGYVDPIEAVTKSTIGGNVLMITNTALGTGNNTAVITYGDVTGNVTLAANGLSGDNSLTVTGYLSTLGAVTTSNIGGGIIMNAYNGGVNTTGNNTLAIDMTTVGSIAPLGVAMTAAVNNNAHITNSTVNGLIAMTAVTGTNTLIIDPSTVNGSATMNAAINNDLTVLGAINGAGNVIESVITGDVGMIAATGANNATLTMSDINGNVSMTAGTDNIMNITGTIDGFGNVITSDIGGSVDMTANTGSNTLILAMATIGSTVTMNTAVDNTLIVSGAIDGFGNVIESVINTNVTMNAPGTNNATLTMTDVNGNVAMTAGTDNSLNVTGAVDGFGAVITSDISGSVTMDAATGGNSLGLTMATTGSSVTMNAALDNLATITDSAVGGDVAMTAGGNNTLMIDPSSVAGHVAMTATGAVAGDNTLNVIGAVDGISGLVIPSSIGTYIDMEAFNGSNSATIDKATVGGAVTMNTNSSAFGNNGLTVIGYTDSLGYVSKSTIGGNVSLTTDSFISGGDNTVAINIGDVTGSVNLDSIAGALGNNSLTLTGTVDTFGVVTKSTIGGDAFLRTAATTLATGNNTVDILNGDVTGNVTLDSSLLFPSFAGDNSLTVTGDTLGGVSTSNIGGGVSMTDHAGDNTLAFNLATVGAGIGLTADTGDNIVDINASAITGNVVLTATLGNNTGVNPVVGVKITASTITGSVNMTAGGTNTLTIDPSTVTGDVTQNSTGASGSNNLTVIGIVDGGTGAVTPSVIGGNVGLTSAANVVGTGNNIIIITDGNVVGNVALDANGTAGGNSLTVTGSNVAAVITPSTISGSVIMNAANDSNTLGLNIAAVGAGIGMSALIGDNSAVITDSAITGSIGMTAGGVNILTIDPSTVSGDVTMTSTDNTLNVLGAGIITSDIAGSISMSASTVNNTLDLNIATVGNGVGMTATAGDNSADITASKITGNVILTATVGNNTGSTPAGVKVTDSTINGNINLIAGGNNTLTIDPSAVNGDVTLNSTAGNNTLDVEGVVGTPSTISGLASLTAIAGSNVLTLVDATIGNGVSMTTAAGTNTATVGANSSVTGGIATVGGTALVTVAATGSVAGGIATGAGNDIVNIAGSVTGGITTGAGDDIVNLNAGGVAIGSIDMGAGVTDTLNVDTLATVTGSVGATSGTLAINGIGGVATISGSVTMTAPAGSSNELDLVSVTIGTDVNMTADAGFTSTVSVDAASTVTGNVTTGAGDDVVNVAGIVTGLIDLGTGADHLNVTGAGAVGNVQAEGISLAVAGAVTSVSMTAAAGSNQLDLNGATVANGVTMSATAGNVSTVNVDGTSSITAGGITTGAGDDMINVDGAVTGNIATAAGNDTLNVNATGTVTGNVDMGDGTDVVNVIAGGTLTGDVQAEGIKLTVTGIVSGAVSMNAAAGSNELDLLGAVIANGITMAATAGNVSTVNVDTASIITANGITTGAGDDLVNVDGIVTGNIATAAGNDTLNINATAIVTGNIDMGAGDDILNVFAGSTITGTIDMGDGNNTVNAIGGTLGDITITVTTGSNLLNLVGATTGNITLTTTTGNNDMTLNATATGAGSAVTMTATTGNNTLTLLNAATIGTGGLTMTATTGDNTATITNSTVNGSVTQTSTTGNNVLTLAGASTIATGVTQTASAGFSSTLSVSAASSITAGGITLTGAADGNLTIDGTVGGNVTTSTGADALTINGSVTGNIDMAAGNDTLTLNVGNASVGTIDMGAGTNTANISVAFDLSAITSTAGDLTIGGTSTAFTVSAGLGVAGQTTSVTDAAATLTFATSGNTVAGTLNTTAAANVLDASGIAAGGSLINAAAATSWDVLAVGDADMKLVGNAGFALIGDSVDLVTGHAVDLTNWNTAGINNVSLTVGATTVSLAWNIANSDYEGVVGANTWTLGDAGNTKLTLGITA